MPSGWSCRFLSIVMMSEAGATTSEENFIADAPSIELAIHAISVLKKAACPPKTHASADETIGLSSQRFVAG